MNWFGLILFFILAIIFIGVLIYFLMYRKKAVFIRLDTDQDGNKKVVFVEKPKKYRIVTEDGKKKAKILGVKQPVPYTENNLNPSHHKNTGAILVEYKDNYYFADANVNIMKKSDKSKVNLEFNPIPYNLKLNFIESTKNIAKKFQSNKQFYIASGIVVLGMIVCFLMIYFTTQHWETVANQAANQFQNAAEGFNAIKDQIIPK